MPDINGSHVSQAILDTQIKLGFGRNREDKAFRHMSGTVGELLNMFAGGHNVGPKDGECILQGELFGERRLAKNMVRNYVLMVDIDTGMSFDAIVETIEKEGLFALIWTTHSHMTRVTTLPESKVVAYATKVMGQPNIADEANWKAACLGCLRDEKLYDRQLLRSCEPVGRKFQNGGIVYEIRHDPMPKTRVLFLLRDPFEFGEGGTQAERIATWKRAYENVSRKLGLPYDSSCVDPSRLMYLPRVPNQEARQHALIAILDGKPLDLTQYTGEQPNNAFSRAAAEKGVTDGEKHAEFKTPGLVRFAKECPDFLPLTWLEGVAPDDARRGGPASGGQNWTCPNKNSHSSPSPDDNGFAIFENEEGWGMSCRHDGCVRASREDRLWYLDLLCQKHGVAHADELRAFSELGKGRVEKETAISQTETLPVDELEAQIEGMTAKAGPEWEPILVAVAGKDKMTAHRLAVLISAKLGKGFTPAKVLKMAVDARKEKAHNDALKAVENGDLVDACAVPENLAEAPSVWLHWPWATQVEATIARLNLVNNRKPFLFRRAEGGVVRLEESVDGRMIVTPVGAPQWSAILSEHVNYKMKDMLGVVVDSPPPKLMVNVLMGSAAIGFPEFKSVSRVPLFSPSGTLVEKKGYAAELKTYLDPNLDFAEVPPVPSEMDVEIAKEWLLEAIRDFPFSDGFNGSDTQPIKLDELDEDGFPLPNLERGRSSRANALAMILQPFARNLIDGPTPAYHIHKPKPGTGAGYLVDVVYCISQGTRAEVQTMSASNEEFRKAITAVLRSGSPIIFVDNINRKVDSGDLAAALTSGVWKDRILGKTETTTILVDAMWIMAGNNLSFSNELLRRNVPIMLDANLSRPAAERGKKDFKHFPLQPWLLKNRTALVWSCHVLIANWIAKGMPSGSLVLNSFDDWARVMGGILEAAGITGLMENAGEYMGDFDEEGDAGEEVILKIAERYGTLAFSPGEALEACRGFNGELPDVIPVDRNKGADSQLASFGKWFKKTLMGGTYTIPPELKGPNGATFRHRMGEVTSVKCIRAGSRKYQFMQL